MTTITLTAPAKLNLYLHILGRRLDGYHLLESLFVFTKFGDVITLHPSPSLSLTINGPFQSAFLHTPIEKNLVYQAALLLQKRYKVKKGANIHLNKHIPISAGLGGGSSDAATVLKGLNILWGLNLDESTLCEIGLSLGADIPACIIGKPAIVSGIGETIHPIFFPNLWVLLVNPLFPLSTQQIFQHFQIQNILFSQSIEKEIDGKNWQHLQKILAKNHNDLERVALQLHPEIDKLLTLLSEQPGCELARMSGSGPTCFALFSDLLLAQKAEGYLTALYPDYWLKLSKICIIKNEFGNF